MKSLYFAKRLLVLAIVLIMLSGFFACAKNADVEPTATQTPVTQSPTAKPTPTPTPTPAPDNKVVAFEKAQEALEEVLQEDEYNFEGSIIMVKHEGMFYTYTYSVKTGLHDFNYHGPSHYPFPCTKGMENVYPSEHPSTLKIRLDIKVYVYDKRTMTEDAALIDSLYKAQNEKRYEDYVDYFAGDNCWYKSKQQLIEMTNDKKARKSKTGFFNINEVEKTEILTVLWLDDEAQEYSEYWKNSIYPYEGFIGYGNPVFNKYRYYYDVINPMFYLVKNEYTVHNEPEKYDAYFSGGTHYWYILVGSKLGERKIQGIWPADDADVKMYEPDHEEYQEYYDKITTWDETP
ncbi:MAG: hypothetical protein GX802_05080 [Clostridiales bacterium]|nr:hypothetical protein [Clostridiales bacterium]